MNENDNIVFPDAGGLQVIFFNSRKKMLIRFGVYASYKINQT